MERGLRHSGTGGYSIRGLWVFGTWPDLDVPDAQIPITQFLRVFKTKALGMIITIYMDICAIIPSRIQEQGTRDDYYHIYGHMCYNFFEYSRARRSGSSFILADSIYIIRGMSL